MLILLQLMFWNVENYFDPFDDPLTLDEEFTISGSYRWSWKKFLAKRDGIAKGVIAASAITGEMPVAVGLAEVENGMVLSQLVRNTPLAKVPYNYIHRDGPDRRGIDVALLYDRSRFTPLTTEFMRVDTFATREILYVKAKIQSDTLHLFINHWPSKRGGTKDARREAAAITLRHKVDSLLSADGEEVKIVICGDFNDTPESPAIATLCGQQLHSLQMKSFGGDGVRGTLRYKGEWETIDQWIVSRSMLESKALIFSPPFLLESDKGYLGVKPRRTNIGPRYNGGVSDHLPIYLISSTLHSTPSAASAAATERASSLESKGASR